MLPLAALGMVIYRLMGVALSAFSRGLTHLCVSRCKESREALS